MPLPLQTRRLALRPFVAADAEPLHERVFGDPVVMERIPRGPSTDVERTRASVDRFIEHQRAHGFSLWAVIERATGELVGDCGLVLVEGQGPEVELAYHFARDRWGRGYATEAARASLSYGHREAGLQRIIAITDPDHVASRRVMERAGMRQDGSGTYYGRELVRYVSVAAPVEDDGAK